MKLKVPSKAANHDVQNQAIIWEYLIPNQHVLFLLILIWKKTKRDRDLETWETKFFAGWCAPHQMITA